MDVILNKTIIEGRKHSLFFVYSPYLGKHQLFLSTDRLPCYPYEDIYDTTKQILNVVASYNNIYRGIYEFVKSTLDDPAVRLFLEVMEFE